MGILRNEVAPSVERMFLAVFICGGVFWLLATATPGHFTALLAFGAPVVATVVSFFFRMNEARPKVDVSKKEEDS